MTLNQGLKYLIIFGILGLLFVPFVVAYSQLFPFITGKAFVFRIAIEIIFALWVILILRDRSLLPRFSWILCAVTAFVALIGIADFFGVNPYKSFWSNYERMEGFVTLIHLFMYFLVVSSIFNTERLWNVFINTSVASSVIMSFYTFFQLAGKITIHQGGVRVDGTFGNATYLAVYILVNIFLTFYLLMRSKNIYARVAYSAVIIILCSVLFNTQTRGAILGLLGGVIVSAILIVILAKGQKNLRRTALGGLIAVIVLIGGIYALRDSDFIKKSPTLNRFTSLSIKDLSFNPENLSPSSQGRSFVWNMAWQGFKERPILGWGQENFIDVFNEHYNPKMYKLEPWFDRTHNIFLDWLIAGGLLGMFAYLSLYITLLWYLWKSENLSVVDKSIFTGLIAAYLFHNIFVFDNLISYILFFSILGYIHVHATGSRVPIKWTEKLTSGSLYLRQAVVAVIIIVVLYSLYFVNMKPLFANRELIRAIDPGQSTPAQSLGHFKKVFSYKTFADPEATEQVYYSLKRFAAPEVDQQTKNEYVKLAKEALNARITENPNDTRFLILSGSFSSRLGENKEALAYLERAINSSPGKQGIYFELGVVELALENKSKALETFKTAYELEKSNPEAGILYAITAIFNNDFVLANKILSGFEETQYIHDERLVSAYVNVNRYDKAVEILARRVALEPNDVQIRFSLAAGYLEMGNKIKAIEELRKAAEINPSVKEQTDYYIKEIQAGRKP